MNDVCFTALCGASELSANAYFVEAHGCRLLLDAGASHRQNQRQKTSWVDRCERPDACWISHAHWDHMGALGPLLAKFPRLACFSSALTRRLGRIALAQVGLDQARASALASQLHAVPERGYVELSSITDTEACEKFRIMVFPAGHIPGAGMLLVEIDVGQSRPFRVLYTGDFCGHDQPGVAGALFPMAGASFEIDAMIMEGVLATRKDVDQLDYARQLTRLQELAGAASGALIGVSSLGQATQVVTGLVDAGLSPVVHRTLEPVLEAAPKDDAARVMASVDFADERQCRQALGAGRLVVAPGEQLQPTTPAGRLLEVIVERDDALIVVLNRAHKKTNAGRLVAASRRAQSGEATVRLVGRAVALGASVEHLLLPNHAPRHQLVAAVEAIAPTQLVLVHGHRSHLFSLKRAIESSGFSGTIDVPRNLESIALSP